MKTMTTKRTTMKMLTRDAFRYIQLAINVPTVSTLLYIWFQSFFSANILYFQHIVRIVVVRIPLFQDHSRVIALAVVKRKGDTWEPHNSCKSIKSWNTARGVGPLEKRKQELEENLKKSWRWRCVRRWDARKPWSPPTFATTPLNWTLQASGVVWALEAQKPGQQGSNAIATQKVFCVSGELLHV